MKRVAIFGSTGSVGASALQVAQHLAEEVEVVALAACSKWEALKEQITLFSPKKVALFDEKSALALKQEVSGIEVLCGREGLLELATSEEVDFVLVAMSGMEALAPTVAALKTGKSVGLANKEILVAAGELIMQVAHDNQATLIPIDSEHNALFQCLAAEDPSRVNRLILTASGGPFRKHSLNELQNVTVEEALAHPTWKMGAKITVDSSNLMNKGFELIEAAFLFNMPLEKVEVVIHPQSIVHSMVEFVDGTIKAEMSAPSMVLPVQYALTYPAREKGLLPPFDFTKNHTLEFFPVDTQKFPAIDLAYFALKEKGSVPCYLSAVNEVLVTKFLQKKMAWVEIVPQLQNLLNKHQKREVHTVEEVLNVDTEGKREALAL